MNNLSRRRFFILIAAVITIGIILDQLTKALFGSLNAAGKLPAYIFADVGFTWAINTGGAWSMFSGKSWLFFLITIIGLPLFCLLFKYWRKRSLWGICGCASFIGGTLGNAIDRLALGDGFYNGGVRDFLSIGGWFPIFNVADMMLTCGAALMILALVFFDHDALVKQTKKAEPADKDTEPTDTNKPNG